MTGDVRFDLSVIGRSFHCLLSYEETQSQTDKRREKINGDHNLFQSNRLIYRDKKATIRSEEIWS